MEYETQIEKLSSKLDKDLQGLLYDSYNYLPTITSTFHCIENSSPSFKMMIKHNFSLEYTIKEEIGKALNFQYSLEDPIKPPFVEYFSCILTALLKKEPDNYYEDI